MILTSKRSFESSSCFRSFSEKSTTHVSRQQWRQILCDSVTVKPMSDSTLRVVNQVNCGEIEHFRFGLFLVFLHREPNAQLRPLKAEHHRCASVTDAVLIPWGLSLLFPSSSCFLWISFRWSISPSGLVLSAPPPATYHMLLTNWHPSSSSSSSSVVLASESESLSFFSSSSVPKKNLRPATRIYGRRKAGQGQQPFASLSTILPLASLPLWPCWSTLL